MTKVSLHQAKFWLVLLTMLFSMRELRANTFYELESTYEGDGWFRYRLRLPVDPFWAEAYITSITFWFSQAAEQVVTPASWSGSTGGYLSPNDPQIRPTEYVFRFRSSYRHFKLASRGFSAHLYLRPQVWHFYKTPEGPTVYAQDFFGIIDHECLIPCHPWEADGSAPRHTMRLSLVPDVKILQLIRDSTGVSGLKYYLPYDASFLVEGSQNLTNWHALANGSAEAGTNQFNSVNLTAGGPFYRIQVVGVNGHTLSSASPVNAGGLKSKPVNGVKILTTPAGRVLTFSSIKSQSYQIDFLNAQMAVLKSFTYQAQSEESTFPVPQELQTGPVFVAVRPLSSASQ